MIRAKKRLDETFFLKDMPFRPDSPMQQKVANDVAKRGLKIITNDEIYKAADYQAFHKGKAVGTLHVVPLGTPFESLDVRPPRHRAATGELPGHHAGRRHHGDAFSTPLSHVNLRAGAWGIPNAGDKKAREQVRQARRQDRLLRGHRHRDAAARGDGRRGRGGSRTRSRRRKHVELPKATIDDVATARC